MKATRKILVGGIVLGALLALSPLVGSMETLFGQFSTYRKLRDLGVDDPQPVINNGKDSLQLLSTTLYLCPVGILLFATSLGIYRFTKPKLAPFISASQEIPPKDT
jgi:hypothetical protein